MGREVNCSTARFPPKADIGLQRTRRSFCGRRTRFVEPHDRFVMLGELQVNCGDAWLACSPGGIPLGNCASAVIVNILTRHTHNPHDAASHFKGQTFRVLAITWVIPVTAIRNQRTTDGGTCGPVASWGSASQVNYD